MDHILEINDQSIEFLELNVFPKIHTGDTVLFLGSGASVGSKRFLAKEIIDYYQDKLGIDLKTDNLIEFMDVLKALPAFNRDDFDNFIVDLLSPLGVTNSHRTIASINWREVITTNHDLILERAFDELIRKNQTQRLITVRSKEEYLGHRSNTDIRYVKLNGCISDKRKYPLVYSSEDFNKSKKYYRLIFESLANLSPNIQFLSVGFSYTDGLSKFLLEKFDSYNYRNRKWIINIDPFVNEHRLPYFTEQRICVIKVNMNDFFNLYKDWEEKRASVINKRRSITFTNKQKQTLIIPNQLRLKLGESITELSDNSYIPSLPQIEFYKGLTPTYDVVRKNYDAFDPEEIEKTAIFVQNILNKKDSKIIPILFLEGDFGIGKSTFTYRLINKLLHDEIDIFAYEVVEPNKLNANDLGELFRICESKNILLLCNELEVDSAFRELMNLRNRLSIEQFSDFSIIIITSIRSNILQKHLSRATYKNYYTFSPQIKFKEKEAEEFIEKIAKTGLISYRDSSEKKKLINLILEKFDGDTFISLISLISDNQLTDVLYSALKELTKKAQDAFVFTSILYQFKIPMPASLLMSIVSKDWEKFKTEILDYDCKGILIQYYLNSNGTEPDLFFKTRHSIISQKLISKVLNTEDKLFEKIRTIVLNLNDTFSDAKLLVDLIKSFSNNNSLSSDKINKLFDLASTKFEISPHFNLHYAINLQHRGSEVSMKKALERIMLSDSNDPMYRNHFLIHRRGVINFELAKYYFGKSKLPSAELRIEEARELFEIKKVEDPFSSFSYYDFIRLEIWCLENMNFDAETKAYNHVVIQELFDTAEENVSEDSERIMKLRSDYYSCFSGDNNGVITILEYIENLYQNEMTRAYSLTLKYNYYKSQSNNSDFLADLIAELELYAQEFESIRTLFKYYGENLYSLKNRIKYFELIRKHPELKTKEKIKYHFYSYIAEAYSRNFQNTVSHIQQIKSSYLYQSPDFHREWIDEETQQIKFFEGVVIQSPQGKPLIRVSDLQKQFPHLRSASSLKPEINTKYYIVLHFYLRGIYAELVQKMEDHSD